MDAIWLLCWPASEYSSSIMTSNNLMTWVMDKWNSRANLPIVLHWGVPGLSLFGLWPTYSTYFYTFVILDNLVCIQECEYTIIIIHMFTQLFSNNNILKSTNTTLDQRLHLSSSTQQLLFGYLFVSDDLRCGSSIHRIWGPDKHCNASWKLLKDNKWRCVQNHAFGSRILAIFKMANKCSRSIRFMGREPTDLLTYLS